LLKTVWAVAAVGLAAVSATQVIGLGEDYVGAFVVELAGLWDRSCTELFVAVWIFGG
jgi:hypothetical protein